MATTKKIDGQVLTGDEANRQAGNIIIVEAGENVTKDKVGYVHLTDGKAYTSDTGTADDIRATGIFLETVSSGADVTMQTGGVYTTTGLTDKADYYLGSAGALSTTLSGVRIGTALSTTLLFIKIIQDDRDTVGTIKAYHKAMSGIPSNNFTAFWAECDGSTLSDSESPLDGVALPDLLTPSSFLRGDETSGTVGGADTHTHAFTSGTPSALDGSGSGSASGSAVHTHTGTTDADTTVPKHMTVVWIIKKK